VGPLPHIAPPQTKKAGYAHDPYPKYLFKLVDKREKRKSNGYIRVFEVQLPNETIKYVVRPNR